MDKFSQILNESVLISLDTEPADSVYAWYLYQKFATYFNQNFTEWAAYKKGLIDKNGKVIKKPETQEEKNSLNAVANLSRKLKIYLKKHASESVIKIISFYLRNQLRTQSQALAEHYKEAGEFFDNREMNFLLNFNRKVGLRKLNLREANQLTDTATIDLSGSVNLKEAITAESIQSFLKSASVSVNNEVIPSLIVNDFYGDSSDATGITVETTEYNRFVVLDKAQDNIKQYNSFNFPSEIYVKENGQIIDRVQIKIMSYDKIEISHNNKDNVEVEAFVEFLRDVNNFKTVVYDVSDIINIDVEEDKIHVYYAGAQKINLLQAKVEGEQLIINALDEGMTSAFVDSMYDTLHFKESTETPALTGYVPPLGKKPKKRKVLKPISEQGEESELLKKTKGTIPDLLKAFHELYDTWQEHDGEGADAEVQRKGLCSDIADAFSDILMDAGITVMFPDKEESKEHVYAIAYSEDSGEAYKVDIDWHKYEKEIFVGPRSGEKKKEYEKIKGFNPAEEDIDITKTEEIFESIQMIRSAKLYENMSLR